MKRYFILGVLLLWGAWSWWQNRSIDHAPGVLAPTNPSQKEITGSRPFTYDDYKLHPRASFSVRARVLSRENYFFGREADLSPTDLALGWGPMSDSSVLDRLRITQGNRFYYWSAERPPIPRKRITAHSANMHLIPATEAIADSIRDVREGHIVRFSGKLVDVASSEGWQWGTSLTRNDTGKGACELVFVEQFEIERSL